MGDLQPLEDDTACVLVGTTSNPHMYANEWLAPIPHPFIIEAGTELQDAMITLAARLADAVPRMT